MPPRPSCANASARASPRRWRGCAAPGPQQADPFVDTLLQQLRDAARPARRGHGAAPGPGAAELRRGLDPDHPRLLPARAGRSAVQHRHADAADAARPTTANCACRWCTTSGAAASPAPSLSPALAHHLLDRQDTPQRLDALLQRRLGKPLSRWLWPDALDARHRRARHRRTRDAAFAAARALWQAQREAIVAIVREAQPRLNQNTLLDQGLGSFPCARWDTLLAAAVAPDSLDPEPKLDLLGTTRLRARKKAAAGPGARLLPACATADRRLPGPRTGAGAAAPAAAARAGRARAARAAPRQARAARARLRRHAVQPARSG